MSILVRRRGLVPYGEAFDAMRAFTDARGPDTPDELWFMEHPPVFTLGLNADPSHVLAAGDIPVVPVDRGGQVTYHGPGQVMAYVLLDLQRRGLGVRALVTALEQAVVATLAGYGITAASRPTAPGVYVGDAKIASLGLRIRRGASYHGLALNVAMDLEPFTRINPCGFPGIPITQVSALGGPADVATVAADLQRELLETLAPPSGAGH